MNLAPNRDDNLYRRYGAIPLQGVTQLDDRAVRSLTLTGCLTSEQEAECNKAIAEATKQIKQRVAQKLGGTWEEELA